jgi:hypothetical protein
VIPVLIIETVYQPPEAESEEFDYFMDEGEPHVREIKVTFRELVRMVSDEYRRPSSFPLAVPSGRDWLNAEGEQDMWTGELIERSLHLSPSASARMARYWSKAWTAGRVRFNFSQPVRP